MTQTVQDLSIDEFGSNQLTAADRCDSCGAQMRWETSHSRCDRCGYIRPCCEGAPVSSACIVPEPAEA